MEMAIAARLRGGGGWQRKPPLHLICLRFGLSAGISDIGGNGC
jgi:hypothetical protein